jgi:hypothetical protein
MNVLAARPSPEIQKPISVTFNQGDQTSLSQNRPKCSPTHFCQTLCIALTVDKSSRKFWSTSVIFKKFPKKTSTQSGHPAFNPREGCLKAAA